MIPKGEWFIIDGIYAIRPWENTQIVRHKLSVFLLCHENETFSDNFDKSWPVWFRVPVLAGGGGRFHWCLLLVEWHSVTQSSRPRVPGVWTFIKSIRGGSISNKSHECFKHQCDHLISNKSHECFKSQCFKHQSDHLGLAEQGRLAPPACSRPLQCPAVCSHSILNTIMLWASQRQYSLRWFLN